MKFLKFLEHPLFLTAIRVVVGGIFVLFGASKAISTPEEFYTSIGYYEFVPDILVPVFANILIYAEIIFGALLFFGLFTRWATIGVSALLAMFSFSLIQAIVRGLELPDCGCSGGLINIGESPGEVLGRDGIMLFGLMWLLLKKKYGWTVDSLLEKKST